MTVRPLKPSDIPILNSFVSDSEVKYPDLTGKMIEHVCVVVDAEDRPIAAASAERIIQAWFYIDRTLPAAVKMDAVMAIHKDSLPHLRALGYTELNGFLSGPKAKSFGRHLERACRWLKNTPSWTLHF